MTQVEEKKRGNEPTLAELAVLEQLCNILLSGGVRSFRQLANKSTFTYTHCYQTLADLEGEDRFGRVLIDRDTLTLTKDGREVFAYARNVLDAYRLRPFEAQREVLRIAVTNRILTTILSPYIAQFMERFKRETNKDLDIHFTETTFDKTLKALEIGEVELAFGSVHSTTLTHSKLIQRTIRADLKVILIAPPNGLSQFTRERYDRGEGVTLKELEKADICLIRRDDRSLFSGKCRPEEGFSRLVCDNYSSIVSLVRAEAGVGLVINNGLPSDLLRFEITDCQQNNQHFAVWERKRGKLSTAAKLLLDTVINRKPRTKTRTPRTKTGKPVDMTDQKTKAK
jgi:DNA-binding transcriptional LysR family regulator